MILNDGFGPLMFICFALNERAKRMLHNIEICLIVSASGLYLAHQDNCVCTFSRFWVSICWSLGYTSFKLAGIWDTNSPNQNNETRFVSKMQDFSRRDFCEVRMILFYEQDFCLQNYDERDFSMGMGETWMLISTTPVNVLTLQETGDPRIFGSMVGSMVWFYLLVLTLSFLIMEDWSRQQQKRRTLSIQLWFSEDVQVMPILGKLGCYKPVCKSSVYLCFPFNKISLAFLLLFMWLSSGHLFTLMLMWFSWAWGP